MSFILSVNFAECRKKPTLLRVVMLNVFMLNVVMLSIGMLSVTAPFPE